MSLSASYRFPPSIWSTIECDAWSRDFDYANYLRIRELSGIQSNPVSEEMYLNLKHAFETEMRNDFLNSEKEPT
jgi:hypothetical protein